MFFERNKSNNGITLIALVISIIVLLILAGISISMLSGDNGLLTKAGEAKTNTDIAQEREIIALAYNSAIAKKVSNGNSSAVTGKELDDELNSSEASATGDTTITVTFVTSKRQYTITGNGEITYAGLKSDEEDMTVAKAKAAGTVFNDDSTTLTDDYGNEIIIPKGFKIIEGTNVTDGIVIEDVSAKDDISKGNQFVWIPVGTIYTNEMKTESKTILLDRYSFQENISENAGTAITWGELPSKGGYQAWLATQYTEESLSRINETGKNATAKNIDGFLSGASKGFYIGRYEARVQGYTDTSSYDYPNENWTSYVGGTLVEKKDVQVYNNITQNKAAEVSRAMYNNLGEFESDLINSYAWDTATLFLQEFGESNYSMQDSINSSLENTGTTEDIVCNVYDMASNCFEYTTESFSGTPGPCVRRGGFYNGNGYYTATRSGQSTTIMTYSNNSFRPILYIK